jgi:Ca-activated chloride channel family protein
MHRPSNPIRVAKLYCLDVSGSMAGPKLATLKSVLVDLVASGKYYAQDLLSLWTFSDTPTNRLPFTPVRSLGGSWSVAVGQMQAGGGTAMAAALYSAIGAMSTAHGFRKTIVLLSDGQPTDGREAVLARAEAARRFHIRISTVGFGSAADIDVPLLRDLARRTGGTYTHASELSALARALRAA